jgi:predicted nucleic acid-binding protein
MNYLVLIDQIELLPNLFTTVLTPDAVYAEMDAETPPPVRAMVAVATPLDRSNSRTITARNKRA